MSISDDEKKTVDAGVRRGRNQQLSLNIMNCFFCHGAVEDDPAKRENELVRFYSWAHEICIIEALTECEVKEWRRI